MRKLTIIKTFEQPIELIRFLIALASLGRSTNGWFSTGYVIGQRNMYESRNVTMRYVFLSRFQVNTTSKHLFDR